MRMKKGSELLKREPVLCIAAVCALLTALAVPPDTAYANYIDLRVLGLLWCLMAVVAELRKIGVFETLTFRLLTGGRGGGRGLAVWLVLLPFFVSMAVTNDVALLTFIPFTLSLMETMDCRRAAVPLLVLQTMAANLGSMATPVGNPQNLYLYATYGLSAGEFFATLLPLTALSLLGLTAAALPVLPRTMPTPPRLHVPKPVSWKLLALTVGLFVLCLLSVFCIFPWWALTGMVLAVLGTADRPVLRCPDYALLATFACFFVVSGNLSRMTVVRTVLQDLLHHSTLLTAVLASQLISNVPTAVLLSGFTQDWRGLLLGVNLGGLGTPVASLASLISMKFYFQWKDAKPGHYLAVFTAANLLGLVILVAAAMLLL